MGRRQWRSRAGLRLAVALLAGAGRTPDRPDFQRGRHDQAQPGFAAPDRHGLESGRCRQDGATAVPLPVPVLRRERQIVVPALSAFGGRLPGRAFQHRLLCAADDDGRAGHGLEARRLRAQPGRRASVFEPYRAGAAATDAAAAYAAGDEDRPRRERHLLLPLRGLYASRLRPASAHQGRSRGVMSLAAPLAIHRARPDEIGLIWSLIRELAEWDGEPFAFAVWFNNFSTFSGRSGVYL